MKKAKQNGFEAGPPVDRSPLPESAEPTPNKKAFPLGARVTSETMERFDIFRCPYNGCFGMCRDEDRGADIDNLQTSVFTCKKDAQHQWMFVRDMKDGMPQETGEIRGLGWSEYIPPKEPDVESNES